MTTEACTCAWAPAEACEVHHTGGASAPPTGQFLARTFSCCCGTSHALVDDNDVWTDGDGRIVGRTACLLAAGRITPEQAVAP